ncbi:MAG: zinc ABC transporter substrate-binding protein [Clostridia bacterium]|nr:zinc ABC transporter substrate-binding protein [Clostridia bacterium]
MKSNRLYALLVCLALCVSSLPSGAMADTDRLHIVTTIFPVFDWVREVVGEDGSADITLLLDSGVDLHSYQPTAADIMKIAACDVFIYVGGESDEWVEGALAGAVNPDMTVINLLDMLGDAVKTEEITEGMEREHDHGDDHDDHGHEEEADEHIWLSLRNARRLTGAIAAELAKADPARADVYLANAAAYGEKLAELDARYVRMTEQAAFHTILFGDRFPFRYLADDYGLTYYAAFSGCSAETEASFQTVVFLAKKVDELGLPAVLTIENPQTRIAGTVVQATAGRNQRILSLDSMQGTTARDIREGVTYLSVMEANLAVLTEALN